MSSDPAGAAETVGRGRRVAGRVVIEAGVLLLFLALSVVMTWPLAKNIDRAVSDSGDPLLNAWIMEWTWHSLTTDPSGFWHAPIFHPLRYTIAFSENLLGITLPLLPFYAAGTKPLVVYNIAMLLGFAFSGYGAFVLGRMVTGSAGAGLVAGIFYAFLPFRFDQIAHLQHVWSGWLPLAVAALIHHARRPGWTRAWLVGAALLFNGLSNGHWLLFGGAAIGLGALTLAIISGGDLRRYWIPLVVVVGLTYGGMYAFMQPYGTVREMYGMKRGAGEALHYSAIPSDWLSAGRYNNLYGGAKNWERGERALFPGAIGLLLAAFAVFMLRREDLGSARLPVRGAAPDAADPPRWRSRLLVTLDVLLLLAFIAMAIGFADRGDHPNEEWKRSAVSVVILILAGAWRLWLAYPRAWGGPERSLAGRIRESRFSPELWLAVLLVALGYLGSLGMNSFLHQFLYSTFEPFRSLRVPARWAMISYVGLVMLAAAGTTVLARRVDVRRRVAVVAMIALVLLFELRAAPIRWLLFEPATPAVYEWLAEAPVTGAVAEVPFGVEWSEYVYLFGATVHHRPLVNGVSGYPTKQHEAIREAFRQDPVPVELLDRLEGIGCGLIVVHNEKFATPESVRRWLMEGVEAGRLAFVRRFDHGAGGDYVFALTSVIPDVTPLRAPEAPDAAGRTPSANARIFLEENGRTYNAGTFGWVDTPKFDYEIKGELAVSGWAMSPWGIREVNLVFGNGAVSIPAETFAWPRLGEIYPWYPETTTPGFRATIKDRPENVALRTDLQVEIVDGRGEVTRLDHLFLQWHPRKTVRVAEWDAAKLDALSRSLGLDEAATREHVKGGDVSPIVDAILARTESASELDFVVQAFAILLDRRPEPEATGYYLTRLGRGGTRRDVVEAILSSGEFRDRMSPRRATSP